MALANFEKKHDIKLSAEQTPTRFRVKFVFLGKKVEKLRVWVKGI